ncbi:MAG: hypothetical protein E5W21_14865 [Mesorhizobium sp.]|nr:MAG: hypothetical protein E5W21_14865 [Mesorhizobium sp.]
MQDFATIAFAAFPVSDAVDGLNPTLSRRVSQAIAGGHLKEGYSLVPSKINHLDEFHLNHQDQ